MTADTSERLIRHLENEIQAIRHQSGRWTHLDLPFLGALTSLTVIAYTVARDGGSSVSVSEVTVVVLLSSLLYDSFVLLINKTLKLSSSFRDGQVRTPHFRRSRDVYEVNFEIIGWLVRFMFLFLASLYLSVRVDDIWVVAAALFYGALLLGALAVVYFSRLANWVNVADPVPRRRGAGSAVFGMFGLMTLTGSLWEVTYRGDIVSTVRLDGVILGIVLALVLVVCLLWAASKTKVAKEQQLRGLAVEIRDSTVTEKEFAQRLSDIYEGFDVHGVLASEMKEIMELGAQVAGIRYEFDALASALETYTRFDGLYEVRSGRIGNRDAILKLCGTQVREIVGKMREFMALINSVKRQLQRICRNYPVVETPIRAFFGEVDGILETVESDLNSVYDRYQELTREYGT